jgi:ribose 5-phosphate isomerase A
VSDPRAADKAAVGRRAAGEVQDGMRVGLGSGSTVHHAIVALGERGADITCVATSAATEHLAREVGLRLAPLDDLLTLDIAIDGADEVDPVFNLTKGGGGAHVREKIVARAARRFVVIVDESKLVDRLGAFGTPLELLDFAPATAAVQVRELGAREVLVRPGRSDGGNVLALARFERIDDPVALGRALDGVPGMVGHGIFPGDMVDTVLVAGGGRVRALERARDHADGGL